MARSLVTGASGFIGANLVRALVDKGDEVHAFVRAESNLWRLKDIEEKIILHRVDVTSFSETERVVTKVTPDRVYHLVHYGGNRGQGDGAEVRRTIIEGTACLYAACQKVPTIKSIVNAGSSSEYGAKKDAMREDMLPEPNIEYGIAKLWATLYGEYLRREKGMPITTLRIFSAYGPYEAGARLFPGVTMSLMEGKSPKLSDPNSVRDFIYVDDIVRAFITATEKPHGVYNIGTGVQSSLREVVKLLCSELGSTIELTWGVDPGREFEVNFWRADISRANKILDWKPSVSLTDGVKKTVAWFKEHKNLYEKS